MVQMHMNCVMSQSLSESEISQKMSLISDSLDVFQNKGDNKKVLSICENGISLLSKNERFYTPVSCTLCLIAGDACIELKDYNNAKFYFYKSFVLDELGKFGIGSYTSIVSKAQSEVNISYFKDLLDLAKSDTTYLKMLALNPDELGYQLNTAAWDNCRKGEYSSAIDLFEMEINLLDAIGETGDDNYLSIIPCIVMCLERLGNFDLALAQADYYLDMVKAFRGEKSILYAQAIQTKAGVEDECGKFSQAVLHYNESLSLIESISGKNNMNYINCLRQAGVAYQHRDDNHIKHLEIELEAEKLLVSAPDANTSDKVLNYNILSTLYSLTGDKVRFLSYAEKAVELLEKEGEIKNGQYANQLSMLCSAYISNHSYQKAIESGEKSVRVFEQIEKTVEEKIMYRQSVSNLSFGYFESGNIDKAIAILQPLLTSEYPDDEYKVSDIQRMATYYQSSGKDVLMKTTIDNSLSLAESLRGKNSDLYANALLYAAGVQEKKGDAIMMLQQAATIFSDLYGVNSESYRKTQKFLSLYNHAKEDKEQDNALNDLKERYGENSTRYFQEHVNYLSTLGRKYQDSKDIDNLYKTSVELDSLSQVIYATFSEKEECYIDARHNFAELVIDLYDMCLDTLVYRHAVKAQDEVVSASLLLYGENNIKYIREVEQLAQIMNHLSTMYFYVHRDEFDKLFDLNKTDDSGFNFSESWKYYQSISLHKCFEDVIKKQQKAIELYKKSISVENRNYARACTKIADYYAKEISVFPLTDMVLSISKPNDVALVELNNHKDKAEQYYNIALNYYKSCDDLDEAASVLQSLHFLYESVKDDSKSASALTEGFALWKNETIKQLSMMTSEEKAQQVFDSYWESQLGHYNSTAYYKSKISSSDNRYAELSYDVQLLSKGLLLKSEIGLRDLINESGNSELINNYEKLVNLQKNISDTEDEATVKTLREEYNKLERRLLKGSELYGNYLQDFSYTFKDVRSSLQDKDVAIEFSTIRMPDRDENDNFKWTHSYFALVLKKDYSSPKVIPLEKKITIDSLYYTVWEPLMEEIQGMENVYFAPAYDLNNMPLESVELPNGAYLSDIGINFYRVSSTREIISTHKSNTYDSMVLYGGLQYNADVEDMIESDTEERARGLRGAYSMQDDIKGDLRSGAILWKYLPGTLKEISDIGSLASVKGIKSKSYTSTKGTESTFKNHSKKGLSIIHIATHGFYIPTHDNISDESMKRSGLAFAGANNIARGVVLPDKLDDGILTANEISKLDFRNVSLVVLSACDTGLGNVTGEGVFGLQRGFKKAGVESLLMSLWPVDDQATQILMVEFYKQLLSGKPKNQALINAQKLVRDTKGFESPEYWAGFILLDGIN